MKQRVMPESPVPDLVVYLQTSDELAQKRLQKAQRRHAELVSRRLSATIHDQYRRFFHLYQNAPLLIANADEMDFAGNDDHFEMLLRAMSNMQGSRHYLNLNEA